LQLFSTNPADLIPEPGQFSTPPMPFLTENPSSAEEKESELALAHISGW
jgi:hypothetical protein